jgi:dTDP-4-dehydrorhamnose reductase
MIEFIYIDTNDSKRPAFAKRPAFFSVEYQVSPELRDRMLALQTIAIRTEQALLKLAEYRLPHAQAEKIMEVLWLEFAETVRPFAGASAETKPSEKDTAAPTSVPSDDSSETQASRSSTKRKATQST